MIFLSFQKIELLEIFYENCRFAAVCTKADMLLRVMSVGQLIFPLSPFDAFSLPQGVPTVAFVYVNADSDMTVKQDLHFNLAFPTPC